jgi:Family of unknown function (DUF6174)
LTGAHDEATLPLMRRLGRRARSASLALALVAAAVVAGCGAIPNPVATPVPPDALHPNVPIPVVPPPAAVPADPATIPDLARHRATWRSLGIGDYAMTVIYGCECGLAGRPIDVTVQGGRLVSATDAGQAMTLDQLTGFPATVDALFDYAERNAGAGKIEFAWDPQFGIPTALGVDPDLQARDDEIRIAILRFTPVP